MKSIPQTLNDIYQELTELHRIYDTMSQELVALKAPVERFLRVRWREIQTADEIDALSGTHDRNNNWESADGEERRERERRFASLYAAQGTERGTQIARLHRTRAAVDERVEALRAAGLDISRPLLQHLNILEFPTELLLRIFNEILPEPISEPEDFRYKPGHPRSLFTNPLHTIRTLRLTCRRFCEIGSELLITDVDIDISLNGLAKLERVASHRTLSKGVRSVKIHMDSLNPRYSTDFLAFTQLVHENAWRRNWLAEGVEENEETINLRADSKAMVEAATDLLVQEPDNAGESENLRYRMLIRRAYEHLHQSFEIQRSLLLTKSFAARVATAVAQMPRARRFELCSEQLKPEIFFPERLYTPESEWQIAPEQSLFKHHSDWQSSLLMGWASASYERLPCPTLTLPVDLFTSLNAAGVSLTALVLDFSSPRHMEIPPPTPLEADQMRALVSNLQVLELKRFLCFGLLPDPEPGKTWATLRSLIEPLVNTRTLRSMELTGEDWNPGRWDGFDAELAALTLGVLIPLRSYSGLRRIVWHEVQIHEREVEALLDGIQTEYPLEIELQGVRLMSGSWRAVLDLLHGRGERHSTRVRNCCGAEERLLSGKKASKTWGYYYHNFPAGRRENDAELFILGDTSLNPLSLVDEYQEPWCDSDESTCSRCY
ncbi:hypothetical protein R3P38DRAFT_3451079 [Favolaschia claudopus]|uniref:F-box domain-containing protein n=1 Tax=Favolaschia claudopus TaxID=2862362 RepID=A0AAV9ZL99_9AGAR